MARSATPAVWPLSALDGQSTLVQHSFEAYYQWVIAPYGGAYRHYGDNDWPYAGLGLAHAFYNLGMVDHTWKILSWTMAHQTAPHLYAWGEAVDPQNFGLVSGDNPHTWMAAELVLLVRDILIREDGQHLDVGPFPESWLGPGATIAIDHAPTAFGDVSYALTRSGDGHLVRITLAGATPPAGFQIELPASLQATSLALDGGAAKPATGSRIALPKGTPTTTISLRSRPSR
jgi:hypothetical protein